MMPTDTDEVVLRFPARPEYLRLARLAAADIASRAGFDYEEIEDLRIAVSELCAMLSSDDGADLSLTFRVDADSVTVGGSSPHAGGEASEDLALAQALVAAVVDEHSLSTDGDVSTFHLVKRRAGTPGP